LVENLRSPEQNLADLGFKRPTSQSNYRLLSVDKFRRLHDQGISVIRGQLISATIANATEKVGCRWAHYGLSDRANWFYKTNG